MADETEPANNTELKQHAPETADESIVEANRTDYELFHKLWADVNSEIETDEKVAQEKIKKALEETLKNPFLTGNYCYTFGDIDFDDPANRCAYLIRFATCHSLLTKFATEEFFRSAPEDAVRPLSTKTSISVVSLGGGPGNDALGFCTALRQFYPAREVKMCVMDLWNRWQSVLRRMEQIIRGSRVTAREQFFGELDVAFDFEQVDLTATPYAIRKQLERIKAADVVLMVKLLSISRNKECILQTIFSSMKAGALLLYIDTQAQYVSDLAANDNTLRVIVGPGKRRFYVLEGPCMECTGRSSFHLCAVQKVDISADEVQEPKD